LANNTRIEIKDGLAEGERVLLNPRAVVAEAREESKAEQAVDVKAKFGGDQAKDMPAIGGSPKGGEPRSGAGPSMSTLDADKDGKISREEAPGPMKANFDQIDTDGDGAISAKELAEAVRKMKQRGAGGGPPGGPGRGGP
jgi:hypothetical protein